MPTISFIIATLKEEQYIHRTLENLSLLKLPYEIIISDGGSTDKTLDIAHRYTNKVTVWDKPRRQTFGEAKNAGAHLAAGEFFVFIDADVLIPDPNAFFAKILEQFQANPRLLAATVPLKPWPENRSLVDAFFCMPLNWFYIISNNIFHSGNASGEFQMIRMEAFRKVGGYREELAAGEDNEMFRMLGRQGRTISYARLCVRHSLRRAHKVGWIRLYKIWTLNGFSVLLRKRALLDEWPVIR